MGWDEGKHFEDKRNLIAHVDSEATTFLSIICFGNIKPDAWVEHQVWLRFVYVEQFCKFSKFVCLINILVGI